MEVPSGTRLIDEDEAYGIIRRRLSEGWVLVIGDLSCIERLEYEAYPPGTGENANFEMIMATMDYPGAYLSLPFPIFLAKKTRRLRELLKGLSGEEYSRLLAIIMHGHITEKSCLVETISAKEGWDMGDAVNRVVQHLRRMLEGSQ